jgi:hypothetical protein
VVAPDSRRSITAVIAQYARHSEVRGGDVGELVYRLRGGAPTARGDDVALRKADLVGAGLYGPFVILTFPDPTPNLVWLENPKNSVYLESAEDVDNYTDILGQLRDSALDPAESRTRITHISKELKQ